MSTSIAHELQAASKLTPGSGETPESYAKRVALKVNDLPDDVWEGLTSKAQKWVNNALEALERREPVPVLDGNPANGKSQKPQKGKKDKAPKAAAAPKATKPLKVKGVSTRESSGTRQRIFPNDVITVKTKQNKWRPGSKSADAFAKYSTGMTVQQALDAGVPREFLTWDRRHGIIDIKRVKPATA